MAIEALPDFDPVFLYGIAVHVAQIEFIIENMYLVKIESQPIENTNKENVSVYISKAIEIYKQMHKDAISIPELSDNHIMAKDFATGLTQDIISKLEKMLL